MPELMKLDEGMSVLELEPNVPNVGGRMYPVLLWDENDTVLIDAGLPGQAKTICGLIEKEGIPLEALTKIFITHHDMDHIGGLAQLTAAAESIGQGHGGIQVYAHPLEKPYIQGELLPIKFSKETLDKIKRDLEQLPPEKRKEYQELYTTGKPKVTHTVDHQQEVSCCGGIKILHMPGHTPGHIGLYLEKYRTLIAGDALNIHNGELAGPEPRHTHDIEKARKSLAVLLDYEIDRIVCYHGGVLSGDFRERIKELAKG
ncbi:putative metallo-hydrolase YflN [Ruminiclostridium hungatei]|uniref:Putative metallo-hydrolase YflN n=1 Tax=Ruminiclostridium hungatei TaxID=48256 RepID=A0A1V4SEB8_RUMHU|nr:MBL fold metallo-hydrolase [Ruminiclostridium hungatei]OPX42200.1 putative metallo-hydrolase YflN [Ruminiclostridium hungatei]